MKYASLNQENPRHKNLTSVRPAYEDYLQNEWQLVFKVSGLLFE